MNEPDINQTTDLMSLSDAKQIINVFLTEKRDKVLCEAIVVLIKFYKDSLEDLNQDVNELEHEKDDAIRQIDQKQIMVAELKAQIETLKRTKGDESDRLKQGNFDLYAKNKKLESEMFTMKDQLASKDDQMQKLKMMINDTDKNLMANASIMDELSEAKVNIRKLKQEAKVYEEENRILESKFENQEEELRELISRLDSVEKAKAVDIRKMIDKFNDEVSQYKDIIEQQTFKIKELELARRYSSMNNIGSGNLEPPVYQHNNNYGLAQAYGYREPLQQYNPQPVINAEYQVQPIPAYDNEHVIHQNVALTPKSDAKSENKPTSDKNSAKNILSFPAHEHLELNKLTIDSLNDILNKLHFKKAELEGQLCRYPDLPKKIADKEKKQGVDDELFAVRNEIAAIRKKLKEFRCL